MALQLVVHDYKAGAMKVKVGLTWTVLELKNELEFQLKIPPHRQHVYVVTDELMDDWNVDVALTERSPPGGPQVSELWHREPELAEWLDKIKVNPKAFNGRAPNSVRADRDICRLAVTCNGLMLEYADIHLMGDKEVVMAALQQNGTAIKFAKLSLRSNKDVVMVAVQQNGLALSFASKELKGDRDIALAALAQDGWALHWVSEELQNDRDVILAAVRNKGRSIMYAGKWALSDRELVTESVKQDGLALEFVDESLLSDATVVMWAVRSNRDALKFADPQLRENRHMLYVAAGRSKAPYNSTFESLCAWHEANMDTTDEFFDV
eukprot:TRINITY_DN43829_c0_g1_i1.p1 TRINITY_DN43829_c0_g1~~TRINITY_DN43829_c0_g1_i1.p1  ORF type:complete len:340 (+),score=75.68 TRINITY_DN43829_c0_g1_i1:54-1022(+)